MSFKIYLSPSNQPNNLYAIGGTNEKLEMQDVARRIKAILDKEYECEAFMATSELSINADGRPKEAKEKGCKVYLAIHSNAGGGGNASGAVAFYHPSNQSSRELSKNIVKELNAICPVPSNRASSVLSGMEPFNGKGFAEVRNPSSLGLISVLAETNFHDNSMTAKWIIANKDEIARAYVKALIDTFNIPRKNNMGANEDNSSPKYYRVQIGAFSKKENAEALQRKLKEIGLDTIIKYY